MKKYYTYRDIKLFSLFVINGGILGLLTYLIQNFLNQFLEGFLEYRNFVSSFLVIVPFLFLNFFIQRRVIFRVRGRFIRFAAANFLILVLISLFTEISFRLYPLQIMINDFPYRLNFIFVSLLLMPLSFFLKRNFVFIGTEAE
jgi:hypothetical protein